MQVDLNLSVGLFLFGLLSVLFSGLFLAFFRHDWSEKEKASCQNRGIQERVRERERSLVELGSPGKVSLDNLQSSQLPGARQSSIGLA